MFKRFLPSFLIIGLGLFYFLFVKPSSGQVLVTTWSSPYRLSSPDRSASQPYIINDQYGFVHIFWIETSPDDPRATINYTNFNGMTWASPVDIYAAPAGSPILYLSPTIDKDGLLHLAWAEGETGPVYVMTAPAFSALSARFWQRSVRLEIPSSLFELRVDSAGVYHVLYASGSNESGLYYMQSNDNGTTWINKRRLDPDAPSNLVANVIKFVQDNNEGLHATWTYIDLNIAVGAAGTWVRYAHSMDGGLNWSFPISIDESDESPDELRMAFPAMTVQDDIVNIVWTGDSAVRREYSYSTDGGETFSSNADLFGDLQGQARGDGLALDSLGRTHFIGNIRWPTGLYYSMWDKGQWTPPLLVYLIRESASDDVGDRISAHDIRMAVRAGNQLVVAFGDAPGAANRGLFTMHRLLNDAPQLPVAPIPTATSQPPPAPTETPVLATSTPQPLPEQIVNQPIVPNAQSPGRSLLVGLVPIVGLLGVVIIARMAFRRR